MAEQNTIPVEMLGAATEALRKLYAAMQENGASSLSGIAQAALEAANVPALLAERDALRLTISTELAPMVAAAQAEARELQARVGLTLFQNGYDSGYTTDGAIEAIELMAGRIEELEAEIAEHETSLDLRWNADQRARERWKAAHPDKPQKWPDHADLCVWLMERVVELEEAAKVVTDDAYYVEDAEGGDYYIVSISCIKELYKASQPHGRGKGDE